MSTRKNTLFNIIGAVIPMFILLVTIPLYLKTLGDVRYGVLALVWLILGYFGFLEMGLGKATANHISRLHNASDEERAEIFWSATVVNTTFGLIAAFILWCVGSFLLTNVLKIPDDFQSEALAALPWMIATLPLALVSSVLNGTLEGRNKFFILNILQVLSTIAFQVVPLIVAYFISPSLAYVIPAAVITRVVMNVPFMVVCFISVPLSFRPTFSWKSGRSLLNYGGWVAVTGMLSPILETIDRFLIGAVVGAQAVTHYTLPYQLVTKIRIIPASLTRALFPKFSSSDPVDADLLAMSALHSLIIVMTPVIIFGIILLRPFMDLWVGYEMSAIAAPMGEILLVGVWANSLAYIPFSLLQGKGLPNVVAKYQMFVLGPFVLAIWFGVYFWGGYGAASAWSIRVIIGALYLYKVSGLSKNSLSMIMIPSVLLFIVVVGAHFVSDQHWLWRAGLMLFLTILTGIWFKQSKGMEVIGQILSIRKTRAAV